MNDIDSVEDRLKDYCPIGPPSTLRAHVVASAKASRHLQRRVALIALAATIVAAVDFRLSEMTYRELRLSQPTRTESPRARAAAIESDVVAMGGDVESARQIADVRLMADAEAESAVRTMYGGSRQ